MIDASDFDDDTNPLELRFESYWTRISDGARIDHTTLAYDAPNHFVGTIDGVLSPHVFNGTSGYYIHTEIWENDGWWPDDHYGDADITSTSMYSPNGTSVPFHRGRQSLRLQRPVSRILRLPKPVPGLLEGTGLQCLA